MWFHWHCASLTHIGYLVVQHRRVISACTASEGDVWFVLFCILSASGKSSGSDHSLLPLPVIRSVSDQLSRYWGWCWRCQVAIVMESDSLLAPLDATLMPHLMPLCLTLMALMWSALANSYWPARCNLRCVDLKKLFCHCNRWSPGLGSSCCQWCGAAFVSGWCNMSACMMSLRRMRQIQLHGQCIIVQYW